MDSPLVLPLEIRVKSLWVEARLEDKGGGNDDIFFEHVLTEALMGHLGCMLVGICIYDPFSVSFYFLSSFHKQKAQIGQ